MSLTTTITLGARQEFWNADTGEIICNMTAAYGDEKYFLWRIGCWPAALIFKGLAQRRKFSMKRTTSPFSPVSMDTRWLQYIAIMNMSIIASIIVIKDTIVSNDCRWHSTKRNLILIPRQGFRHLSTWRLTRTSLRSSMITITKAQWLSLPPGTSTTPIATLVRWHSGPGWWSTTPIPIEYFYHLSSTGTTIIYYNINKSLSKGSLKIVIRSFRVALKSLLIKHDFSVVELKVVLYPSLIKSLSPSTLSFWSAHFAFWFTDMCTRWTWYWFHYYSSLRMTAKQIIIY